MLTIDDKWLKEYNVPIQEVLVGLLCKYGLEDTLTRMKEEHRLVYTNNKSSLTPSFNDVVDSILLSSDTNIPSYDTLFKEATKLRLLVPQIKKKNTLYYFPCNNYEITLSLQKLFKYYKDELYSYNLPIFKLIEDTIRQFYSNFTAQNEEYFPLLKYFIIKIDDDEISSPLISEIEMIRDGTNK